MIVATTGFFDGVHIGHRAVIDMLLNETRKRQGKSAVISFWPHPRAILQQDAYSLKLLNSMEEKRSKLYALGIDYVEFLPFTKEFSKIDSRDFMKKFLVDKGISSLVVGYDHRLGQSNSGSLELAAEAVGLDLINVSERLLNSEKVSSTRIRNLLSDGKIKEANQMLDYHYCLEGVVVLGNRIGRTIGFPTANIQLYEPMKLTPANGVYKVKVNVLGKDYLGLCNIGNRPTIGRGYARTIETHIFNFDEDIYGLDMKIEFIDFVRGEKKFDSLDDLKNQIHIDKLSFLESLV